MRVKEAEDEEPIEPHRIMAKAIPYGLAPRIATLTGYSADYVRRWCRAPEQDDDTSTGRRCPLLTIILLMDALAGLHPEGLDEIVDAINNEAATLRQIRRRKATISKGQAQNKARMAARMMSEVADALAGDDDG